jgi:hypothetical protein
MKTVLLATLLLTIAGIAQAEIPPGGIWALYSSCNVSAGIFLAQGGTPRKECAYPLGNAVAMQKVTNPDGYLLSPNYERGDTGSNIMFLRTTMNLTEGTPFNGEIKVKWIGYYVYTSINGFEQKILAFDQVTPQ